MFNEQVVKKIDNNNSSGKLLDLVDDGYIASNEFVSNSSLLRSKYGNLDGYLKFRHWIISFKNLLIINWTNFCVFKHWACLDAWLLVWSDAIKVNFSSHRDEPCDIYFTYLDEKTFSSRPCFVQPIKILNLIIIN